MTDLGVYTPVKVKEGKVWLRRTGRSKASIEGEVIEEQGVRAIHEHKKLLHEAVKK